MFGCIHTAAKLHGNASLWICFFRKNTLPIASSTSQSQRHVCNSVTEPPAVPFGLEGRELALAEDAAHSYEPSGRDIMNALGQIARNMVVKDELRAEITEALLPVYANIDAIRANSDRALAETKNLNERISALEQKRSVDVDRVTRLEKLISNIHLDNLDGPSIGASSKNDPNHCRIAFKGFITESVESRMDMVRQGV